MNTTRHHTRLAPHLATIVVGLTLLTACGSTDTATLDGVDTANVALENGSAAYTIDAGDTLTGIAKRAGVSVDDVVAANGWTDGSDHLIVPGDVIKLPQGTSAAPAAPAATDAPVASDAVDTTYVDLYFNEGRLYDPFYPDAVGGDINYLEPECNVARDAVASFGAARGNIDAAGVLATLEALNGDLPSNYRTALDTWQAFIADSSDAYDDPFRPISQGDRSDATVRKVLVDPAVVDMFDAYMALELKVPQDFIGYLNNTCTWVEV